MTIGLYGRGDLVSDIPSAAERRDERLRAAHESLGPDRTAAAQQRGHDMTLATAAELAILLAGADAQAQSRLEQLDAGDRELIFLVAQGRGNADIAARLGVSAGTVRYRLDRVRGKAGCKRRADLVRLALQAGLV